MAALPDDALLALWSIADQTGIRPEYLIPVLYFESGFQPSAANAAGAPYYGIAQTSAAQLAALGTTPAAYLGMSAAAQIALAVAPFFRNAAALAPIRSATRAYQANFLPATLPTVRGLTQVVAPHGTSAYASNPALDPFHHGAILLSDLAAVMSRSAEAPAVKQAIARAYALRPSAGVPRNPVYGTDFVDPLLVGAVAGLAAAWAIQRGLAK